MSHLLRTQTEAVLWFVLLCDLVFLKRHILRNRNVYVWYTERIVNQSRQKWETQTTVHYQHSLYHRKGSRKDSKNRLSECALHCSSQNLLYDSVFFFFFCFLYHNWQCVKELYHTRTHFGCSQSRGSVSCSSSAGVEQGWEVVMAGIMSGD